jgi:hypothetical protein
MNYESQLLRNSIEYFYGIKKHNFHSKERKKLTAIQPVEIVRQVLLYSFFMSSAV